MDRRKIFSAIDDATSAVLTDHIIHAATNAVLDELDPILLAAEKLAEAADELRGWCVAMDLPEGPRIAEVKLYRALLAWKEASK